MPREDEMRPKDKYSMFDRKEKTYRKGIHSESGRGSTFYFEGHMEPSIEPWADRECARLELPKWTRVSQRINPPGF